MLRVDLAAIAHNYRRLADAVAPSVYAAVVKANAYGLGADVVAPVLQDVGCRHFFVAQLSEALVLRPLLRTDVDIFVLNGLTPGAEAECAQNGIVPVHNSLAQVQAWAGLAQATGRRLPAVLQVDSGMSRLGLPLADCERLSHEPGLLDWIEARLVMSHLAAADEPDHPANCQQLAAFLAARAVLPPMPASLVNSAGIFLGPDYHFDLARPGAALYGLGVGPAAPRMRQAVSLQARVAQFRTIEAGTGVGYGYAFRAARPMRLATISVGYADGWPRSLSGKGAAWFGDTRLPIVGRVSMDSFSVDVSGLPENALKAGISSN